MVAGVLDEDGVMRGVRLGFITNSWGVVTGYLDKP